MRYSCKKTAIYNDVKVFCGSVKPTFYFFNISRARKYLTRIYLIIAHATLAHATLSNRGTARLGKRRASCGDRLASSLGNYSVKKSMRSRVFANKIWAAK
jgi:hypothetical protein